MCSRIMIATNPPECENANGGVKTHARVTTKCLILRYRSDGRRPSSAISRTSHSTGLAVDIAIEGLNLRHSICLIRVHSRDRQGRRKSPDTRELMRHRGYSNYKRERWQFTSNGVDDPKAWDEVRLCRKTPGRYRISTAETKYAKWRRGIVPVWLTERGL